MTPPSPTPDLAEAATLHQAGRLTEASAAYQRVLAAAPNTLAAIHGLALIAIDIGQPDRAVPLLLQCIRAEPKNGGYRATLGFAFLKKGAAEEAAAHLLEAANLAPHSLEPRLYLARALGQLGRWSQAGDVLNATTQVFPDAADVWAAKGNAERVLLRHADAEHSLRRAQALTPHDAEILNNLGVVVRALGRTEEAVGYYREALARAPDSGRTAALIHANLGNALTELGRPSLAESHLRRAVEVDPGATEARYNLAVHLTRDERPTEAIPHFQAIVDAAPGNVDAWTNFGVALLDSGDPQGAERCYRRAIALQPDNGEAHYNLAWVLLLTGQWGEGWREYEWRWRLANFSSRKRGFTQPLWDGAALPSGTLLLHAEQGFGDAIQCVRYAALAKTRAARVIVECPRPLVRLFKGLAGVDDVVAAGDALPPFDAQTPFMSLPGIFGSTPATVPSAAAYVTAPDIPAHLRLPPGQRPRIGLVWAGSPTNKIDRRRTIPARLFAGLVAAADADFVSLQVGPRADGVKDLPPEKLVFACEGRVADFAETAAVIAQLDLVIGTDTAVMHLAAAMGKPTWTLLPFMPDYRWLLGRKDTPWYSSMILFRQKKSEDWPGALADVAAALTTWQPKLG